MNIDAWTQSLSSALSIFWAEIASFLPNLIATIVVVVIGLYLSKLVTKWIAKIIQKVGFNGLCEKLGIEKSLQTLGFKAGSSELVGGALHIFFVLIIFVAAADTLGLDRFSVVIDKFVLYLPKLFGAVLIALIGLFIAKKGKTQVESALNNVGVEYSASVGRVLQILILFVTFSLVVGQLDLETQLLNTIFTVLIASLGIALALALGLGTKGIANNIVSGIYAREQLLPGDEVTFDGFTGNVVMVSKVSTLLENKNGEQLCIPNQELLNTKYTVVRLADRK